MKVIGTGTYERNTVDIAAGLASIQALDVEAVVMVGAYQPLAAFIKASKAAGMDLAFATIFTGTEAIIADLGDHAEGLIISQVVPDPHGDSSPLMKTFRAALEASNGGEPTFGKLEGYITARVLAAGLEQAGPDVTRKSLMKTMTRWRQTSVASQLNSPLIITKRFHQST